MDDPFSQLPKAAVLVYAGVLTATPANAAFAGELQSTLEVREDAQAPSKAPTCGPACHDPDRRAELDVMAPPPEQSPADLPVAPTCGPACHDPNYREPDLQPEPDPVAPTCGPSCHEGRSDGGGGGDEAPPPLPPEGRKGCAVVSPGEPETDLALLGLGLSLGIGMSIAGRRRTRASQP